MKKIILVIISIFIFPCIVSAKKEEVKLDKCIDGDTISVVLNKNEYKVRFLAVDAPEIDKEEPYAIEAKDFTCNLLENSKHIYLEYDINSDKYDKYDRILAWVWVDKTLVQSKLLENGLAKVAYLYDEYKYTKDLLEFENYAKTNKINIWSSDNIKENAKKEEIKKDKKSKKEIIFARIKKSYEYIVILLAMILSLITFYKRNKKSKLRKKR